MRIMHVLAPAPFGGLENVVRLLATGQRGRGHHVTVCAVLDDERDHPFVTSLLQDGIDLTPVVAAARQYRSERRAVREAMNASRPAIVHTHGYRPDILHLGAAHAAGAAAVTTLHGFTGGDWKNRVYEQLQIRAAAHADAAVAVSSGIGARLRRGGALADRVHVIPNAIAPVDFLSREVARAALAIPADAIRIGWVGRLSHEKGADVLVRALASVPDSFVSVSFIGDGPERPAVERLASSLGVRERVVFHGVVASAASLLRAFDVVVLSSRTEGTPMILLEAMAAGVPVVAASVGGVPDVAQAEHALLVPPDDPAALGAAIARCIGDREGAAMRVGRAVTRVSSTYAPGPWLDRYDALYSALARPRS